MNPLCLIFSLLAQAGPNLPALKGLRRPLPMATSSTDAVRTSLKEIGGGAVVVVEDDLPMVVMPKVFTSVRILGGKLQLFNRHDPQPTDLPVVPWMDTDAVVSGAGNVVSRTYPIGWGY
jgi:hypothetical protein